jgi:hypothetical protein
MRHFTLTGPGDGMMKGVTPLGGLAQQEEYSDCGSGGGETVCRFGLSREHFLRGVAAVEIQG